MILVLASFSFLVFAQNDAIRQISDSHCYCKTDSIVLKNSEDLPYYSKIEIYRNNKKIFDYTENNLEIEAYPGRLCKEFDDKCNKWYYIFQVSNRPQMDFYLVVQSDSGKTKLLGKTPTNSADIFGDIDLDGVFEIGGLTSYYESSDGNGPGKAFYSKSISVFKIKEGFPVDIDLTKAVLGIILKKNKLN